MREQLSNNFESRKLELVEKLDLRNQWEKQARALRDTGILEILGESNEMGIIGINGKEYPLPSYEDILDRITPEKLELLERKAKDGFNQLVLVPFALSLDVIIERYKKLLLKKDSEGNFNNTDGEKLELNRENPINIWEGYKDEEMIYYPKEFSDNHQGKTKKELLEKGMGWQIILLEDLPSLPSAGEGREYNKKRGIDSERIPPEAKKSSKEYLEMIQKDPRYDQEEGLTIEAWLAYAMTYLQKNNRQIDDYQGQGKFCYLIGSYFCSVPGVAIACWNYFAQQLNLNRISIDHRNLSDGSRFSVRI